MRGVITGVGTGVGTGVAAGVGCGVGAGVPREADIEHTLEAEQAVVDGTIEAVYPWKDNACIVCNA